MANQLHDPKLDTDEIQKDQAAPGDRHRKPADA